MDVYGCTCAGGPKTPLKCLNYGEYETDGHMQALHSKLHDFEDSDGWSDREFLFEDVRRELLKYESDSGEDEEQPPITTSTSSYRKRAKPTDE